jgi:hypothetical protein
VKRRDADAGVGSGRRGASAGAVAAPASVARHHAPGLHARRRALRRCAPAATPSPAPHPVLALPGCRHHRSSAAAPLHLLLPRTPAPTTLEEIHAGMEPRPAVVACANLAATPTSHLLLAASVSCPPPVGGDHISTAGPCEPTTSYSRPDSAETQENGVSREPGSGVDFGS